jgi:hypothetical protein
VVQVDGALWDGQNYRSFFAKKSRQSSGAIVPSGTYSTAAQDMFTDAQ